MTLLALRALLARVPGIVWVALFCFALAIAAGVALYRRGVGVGETAVHRAALVDSARVAHAAVDTATRRSDGAVVVARRYAESIPSALSARTRHRDAVRALLDSAPPGVIALVQRDDTLIARLDTTIRVQASAIDTLLLERAARIAADTVEAHQIAVGAPARASHRGRWLVVGGTIGAAVVWALVR